MNMKEKCIDASLLNQNLQHCQYLKNNNHINIHIILMYSRLLEKYPLITKCITSGTIMSAGDFLSQKLIEKKKETDWKRNANFFLLGTLYLGPCLHVWYTKSMPQIVTRILGSNSTKFKFSVVGMLFDQLIFAPFFLAGFFTVQGLITEKSVSGIKNGMELCKDKLVPALLTNWKIWPIATLINLSYVPIAYRVLFANFIGLFWNMYLSYLSNC